MDLAGTLQGASLDLPTLSLVAVCIAGLLGVFLIIDWMQQRNVRALAWWGSAYLMGASGIALASMPTPLIELPAVVPGALTFLACGMIWNGVTVSGPPHSARCDIHRRGALAGHRANSRRAGKWKWTDRRRADRPGLHVLHRLRALARTTQDAILACCSHCGAMPA